MVNRQDVVANTVLKGGVSINDINRDLVKNKKRVLHRGEVDSLLSSGLVDDKGLIPQFFTNVKDNTLDLLRGLKTVGAISTQYALESARKARDKVIGKEGSYPMVDTINPLIGAGIASEINKYNQDFKDNPLTAGFKTPARWVDNLLVNPVLEDFGTSTNDVITSIKEDPSQIPNRIIPNAVYSIYDKPVSTGLDLAPISKALPEGSIAKAVHKLPISKEIKYMFETPEMKTVNNILSDNKVGASTRLAKEMDGLGQLRMEALKGNINPTDIVKSLRTGEWKGDKSAIRKMRDISNQFSQYAYELGVPAREMDDVVRANHYMALNQPGVTSGYMQDLINRFESGANVNKELNKLGTTPEQFEQFLQSADTLKEQGKIAHISQILAGNRPDGLVESVEPRTHKFLSKQNLGNATDEVLGDVLFDTYDYLGNRLQSALSMRDSLGEIVNKFGRKFDKTKGLANNEVLISPSAINQAIANNYNKTSTKLDSLLKPFKSDNIESLSKKYNDLVAIDQTYLDQLARQQARPMSNMLNNLNTSFKGTVLSSLKFFTDNRYGNAMLNALEGVTPKDYLDAFITRKDMPSKLLQQTSYAGYLDKDFAGNRFLEAQARALSKLKAKDSTPTDRLKSLNMMFSNLIIPIEAKAEGIDRYANMIRQAKRLGGDWKDTISKADKSKDLYRFLNSKVNDSMGDYVGRNFAINPKVYEGLNLLYNFYKYPGQSTRVMMKQAVNRPLAFQTMVMDPARAGEDIATGFDKELELGPDYTGGVISSIPFRSWDPTVVTSYNANPMTAPLEVLYKVASGNPQEVINISPVLNYASNILNYKNNYNSTPTSPDYKSYGTSAFARDQVNPNILYDYYEPTNMDRLKYGLATVGKNFITPLNMGNSTILPISSYLLGETFYPSYDTTILGQVGRSKGIPFLVEGNLYKQGRTGFDELMGNLFGLRREKIYPERQQASPSMLKYRMKRGAYEMKGIR